MSSIRFPPHVRTMAEIEVQPKDTNGDPTCGCHQRGEEGRWWLCPYHLGVDEGFDERLELIKDLSERIKKGVNELAYVHNPVVRDSRVEGKIEGMMLVLDWLRSYE